MFCNKAFKCYTSVNLVLRIVIGLIIGIIIGSIASNIDPSTGENLANGVGILGKLFVSALKAIAPLLVFILIASSILLKDFQDTKGLKTVIVLYLVGTFLAACVGVIASFLFPISIHLNDVQAATNHSPQSVVAILKDILFKVTDNPVNAIATGNFISILAWSIGFGIALRYSSKETKNLFKDFSEAITKIVKVIIEFAPFGVIGLVTLSIFETGSQGLINYGKIVILLVVAMAFLALIVNPIIAFITLKKNPYPLVFKCLKDSGIYAFFTRSSAANIPVNMQLCKKLNLDENIYSISIPLGATINMGGAAVVIAILSLSTAHTLGIDVGFFQAILLCLVATIGACGASGIAGGSLMLIPLACSLFNIPNEIALQVVAIGFIIGVIQDSVETAINSSTDVLFTAIASQKNKE